MSRFKPIKRDMNYLFPPSMSDWLPAHHLARFIVEIVEQLDLKADAGDSRRDHAVQGLVYWNGSLTWRQLFRCLLSYRACCRCLLKAR